MDTVLVGKYEGEMQNGRYHGRGKIVYGDSTYEGTFYDGQMHGEGKMTVKHGYYQGYWENGKLASGGFVFDDGLEHKKVTQKTWDYCSPNDPRFYGEIKDGIENGMELRDAAAHDHAHLTPKDCFDTVDGYYDAFKHAVFDYRTNEIVRTPNQAEIDWILANCRVGKGYTVG